MASFVPARWLGFSVNPCGDKTRQAPAQARSRTKAGVLDQAQHIVAKHAGHNTTGLFFLIKMRERMQNMMFATRASASCCCTKWHGVIFMHAAQQRLFHRPILISQQTSTLQIPIQSTSMMEICVDVAGGLTGRSSIALLARICRYAVNCRLKQRYIGI